jgi:hypothetical protein
LSLIAVRSDTYVPGAILLLLFILLYLVHIGKYPRKAKSVLPPEWESKRIAIAERHNLLVGVVGFAPLTLYVVLLVLAQVLGYRPSPPSVVTGGLFVCLAIEIYGLFRVLKYDAAMCERLGFMCPHCGKPLYEPRNFINVTGPMPKVSSKHPSAGRAHPD